MSRDLTNHELAARALADKLESLNARVGLHTLPFRDVLLAEVARMLGEAVRNAIRQERARALEIVIDKTDHWRNTQSAETVNALEDVGERIRGGMAGLCGDVSKGPAIFIDGCVDRNGGGA